MILFRKDFLLSVNKKLTMKKIILLSLTLIALVQLTFAQKTPVQLKKKMTLQMPGNAEDDYAGTRGAAVVWHPVRNLYYASYGGNANFPMAVFNKKGERISDESLTAMVDTRGLWYNNKTKQIEGHGYDENGWFYYELDGQGIPTSNQVIFEGMHQPESQSFGMYDPSKNNVLFKSEDNLIIIYDRQTGEEVDQIYLSKKDENDSDFSIYRRAFIITDKKGGEIGLLDDSGMQIDFFSKDNGMQTRSAKLPEETKIADVLSFAYANGYIWILDDETRSWSGFKL